MRIRHCFPISAILLAVLSFGSLSSCDLFNPTKLGFTHVQWWGGAIAYGTTEYWVITLSEVPFTTDFQVKIVDGEGPIGYHGISDITDQDDPSWHQGNMTIDYADETTSFEISGDEEYPFTITLADETGNPVTSGTTYEIEVGIENKEGILPNPYIFRYRVLVTP